MKLENINKFDALHLVITISLAVSLVALTACAPHKHHKKPMAPVVHNHLPAAQKVVIVHESPKAHKHQQKKRKFELLDLNKDGTISKQEWSKHHNKAPNNIERLDKTAINAK